MNFEQSLVKATQFEQKRQAQEERRAKSQTELEALATRLRGPTTCEPIKKKKGAYFIREGALAMATSDLEKETDPKTVAYLTRIIKRMQRARNRTRAQRLARRKNRSSK